MLVNDEIRRNHEVSARIMKHDEAIKAGAMALFGEKYGDEVRVIGMGEFSTELCGGTHVKRTGDIGFFKIVAETGIAAGVRRIEAVTGPGALEWVQQQEAKLGEAAAALKTSPQDVGAKIAQIMDNVRSLEKELSRLKSKLASLAGRRARRPGGRRQRHQGARRVARRRRRQGPARSARQAEGQAQVGGGRARRGERRQGVADRGRDRRSHRAGSKRASS